MKINRLFPISVRLRRAGLVAAGLLALICAVAATPVVASDAKGERDNAESRARYNIQLTVDFDKRSYRGEQTVRWTNTDDRPTNVLYFHLYPNLRVNPPRPDGVNQIHDEPALHISSIKDAATGAAISYALDDQSTVLRVELRDSVQPGESTDLDISFTGEVPEIDPEETGLLAHVVQQVGAALRSERESRRARDTAFYSRGVMLLGACFPLLAARDGNDWQRKVELTIGDSMFGEPADFDVTVNTASDVRVFAPGEQTVNRQVVAPTGTNARSEFHGEQLRDFTLLLGRNLKASERIQNGVIVKSVYSPDHEAVALKVLNDATNAVRVFTERFGELPLKSFTIADAPLVAGFGSAEFSGFAVIASAFYVNFDSPQIRNLPELIREQRDSVEDSLEWTVAHVVAHQWWGTVVGSDPQRTPVLDESLANYSALLYYREIHSPERAETALNDQLKGVYKVYRTFGGEDLPADRSARDYRNFFQYSAIVMTKGALMFAELRRMLGDEIFFGTLRDYYKANQHNTVQLDDLRAAFADDAPANQRREINKTLNRWLSAKRGDTDIATPDPNLADALGLSQPASKTPDRNAFARLGKFFWQQMTRIR